MGATSGAAKTLASVVRAAEVHGSRPLFSYVADGSNSPGAVTTYEQFVDRALRLATELSSAGVGVGTRLGLIGRSDADFVEIVAAGLLLGAMVMPVNCKFKNREISAYLNSVGCEFLYADDSALPEVARARDDIQTLKEVFSFTSNAQSTKLPAPDSITSPRLPIVEINPVAPGIVLHTSGTTGLPKAVLHSQQNYVRFLERWAEWVIGPTDRVVCFGPYYHQSGLLHNFLAALNVGAPIRQLESFSATTFWDHIDDMQATVSFLIPPVPSYLLARPESTDDRAHSLRFAMAAGRSDHWLAFQERFGVACHSGYSSTETVMIGSTGWRHSPPVDAERLSHQGYLAGQAIQGWAEIRIADENDDSVTAGAVGSILVRGRSLFQGYLNAPDAQADAFAADGWFRTGDTGYLSENEELHIIDRTKDLIRRSSEMIAPAEIEMALLEHPAIAEAAVVPTPDPFREQEIRACIVLAPDTSISAEEVFLHCQSLLADYKVPRYLNIRDSLPRTPTFKIKKAALISETDQEAWVDRLAQRCKPANKGSGTAIIPSLIGTEDVDP